MPASEAQIQANRLNSLKSTGPSSAETKERTRRNSLKHGLSGAGVVLASDDVDPVEARRRAFLAEYDPKTEIGLVMISEMAKCSVRMERSGRHELAASAMRVRHAEGDFEEGRLDEVDRLIDGLAENPRTHVRKLRGMPEGVDALIEAWLDLRDALTHAYRPLWTPWHRERAENLAGDRVEAAEGSRIFALSRAVWGDFSGLGDPEGGDLDVESRKDWARERLVERIDAEVADLETHLQTIDFKPIAADRAQAANRALFDPSKEATLARRYEAEATRGFFRALGELKRAEAEHAARTVEAASPETAGGRGELASFREREVSLPRDPRPLTSKPLPVGDRPWQPPQIATESTEDPPSRPA